MGDRKVHGVPQPRLNKPHRSRFSCLRSAGKLCELEDLLEDTTGQPDKLLKQLYTDLGTITWAFTRELIQTGLACDFDCSNTELRELAFQMAHGPGETKSCLENTFGYLQDTAARQSKSLKMSPFSRHAYSVASPFPDSGGCRQVRPSREDLLSFSPNEAKSFLEEAKPYKASTTIPVDGVSVENIEKKWRKAGFHANRDASAASALLCHSENLQRDLPNAWCCCCAAS